MLFGSEICFCTEAQSEMPVASQERFNAMFVHLVCVISFLLLCFSLHFLRLPFASSFLPVKTLTRYLTGFGLALQAPYPNHYVSSHDAHGSWVFKSHTQHCNNWYWLLLQCWRDATLSADPTRQQAALPIYRSRNDTVTRQRVAGDIQARRIFGLYVSGFCHHQSTHHCRRRVITAVKVTLNLN
jgi:hypothetical protein